MLEKNVKRLHEYIDFNGFMHGERALGFKQVSLIDTGKQRRLRIVPAHLH